MSTQLLVNVIAIGPLGVGDSVTVQHGLRSNDRDVAPTLIQPDRATPIVVNPLSVTDTEVTFTNNGSAPAEAVFRFERGLSNEVDAETVGDLYWQGVVAGGGGGGVNAVTATAPITATGFPVTDIALDTTANLTVTGGGDLDLSDTTVTAAAYGNLAAANQSIVPTFTVDAKGRLTAAASGAIQIGGVDAKTYVDSVAGGSTLLAQTYYVTSNGNDATGDGSISKPFATIQKAHDTAATTYAGGEFVQIIVGPGTYSAALSITRLNTFIVGSGPRPEDQGTKVQTAVTISPTGGSKFNNQIAIDGCYVTSSTNAAAITVSGTGAFTLTLTNSYITSTNAGASASAFACSNANVKVVGQNCTLTTQGTTSAAVINISAGDVKFQAAQVQNTAGSTSNLAKLTGTGYLFCDSIIFENATAVASIDSVGTQPVGAAYKLLVSNSSITSPLAAAGIVANAPSTTSIVTGVVFTVPAGFPIISAPSATGVVVYGNLTSTPTYSVSITGSGATAYSENHGRLYLPSLGDGVLVKGTASAAVSVVAAGGTDGNVLTASGGTWVSLPTGLVPVPAGSPVLTNGKAVAISSSGALALASANNLLAAPAVGLYVTGGYIRVAGEFTGLSGLVAGSSYYLNTVAGELTTTPPSTSGNVVQYIGRATSTTSLFVSPATIVIA